MSNNGDDTHPQWQPSSAELQKEMSNNGDDIPPLWPVHLWGAPWATRKSKQNHNKASPETFRQICHNFLDRENACSAH